MLFCGLSQENALSIAPHPSRASDLFKVYLFYLRYLINYTGPTVSYWSPTVATTSTTSISISLKHVTTCDLQVAQFL